MFVNPDGLFNKDGTVHWRDPRSGREYPLDVILKITKHNAFARELEHETSDNELYRQVATRSMDVEGSPESRIVKVDNQQQHIIRACGVLMPVMNDRPFADYQFYNARMSQAIQYLAQKHGFEYGSDAYKELAAFLWMVYQNRYSKAVDQMCEALGIAKSTYYDRIDTYRADLEEPEWKMVTDIADALIERIKAKQRQE